MLGLTFEELTDRVMSTMHGADTEPHVLAALHMLSGCGSSHAYLLLFCALAKGEQKTMHNRKNATIEKVWFGIEIVNFRIPSSPVSSGLRRFRRPY
jgi:hypothetical protein